MRDLVQADLRRSGTYDRKRLRSHFLPQGPEPGWSVDEGESAGEARFAQHAGEAGGRTLCGLLGSSAAAARLLPRTLC